MTNWRKTALSVDPPLYQMGHLDRRALAFDAGEPVTGATVALRELSTRTVPTGPVVDVAPESQGATVTVSALTRGLTYELELTFARADGESWTKTLVIECVA